MKPGEISLAFIIARLGDGVTACIFLALTAPLMLVVSFAIRCDSPDPVFDRETHIGCCGRGFQMLRFRITFYDPDRSVPISAQRTTQVGQFLRYSRIEALPQLINVLRGEMSLIEPVGSSPTFLD
jgi:lipopolysaccharide/colanic/teichoic acid biosynthesis glycosyltransferase